MTWQKVREAWKTVVAAIPVIVFGITAIVSALNDAGVVIPPWLATVFSFVIALGVYFKRNDFSSSPETSTPGPDQAYGYFDDAPGSYTESGATPPPPGEEPPPPLT